MTIPEEIGGVQLLSAGLFPPRSVSHQRVAVPCCRPVLDVIAAYEVYGELAYGKIDRAHRDEVVQKCCPGPGTGAAKFESELNDSVCLNHIRNWS